MKYFDYAGFRNYYLSKSKLSNKQALVNDFRNIWMDKFGSRQSLTAMVALDVATVKKLFNAQAKKDIKIRLQSNGYSSQAIDSLFKCFSDWLKASK